VSLWTTSLTTSGLWSARIADFITKGIPGYERKILLEEADAYSALPMLLDAIDGRCESCDEEYLYKQKEIMRDEAQVPENFVAHPLFRFT
jgi:hypothetical protein